MFYRSLLLLPVVASVLSFSACSPPTEPEDYASILPDARLLAPAQVSNSVRSLGQASEFADATADVVNDTNNTIGEVLDLIDLVTSFPASWSDEQDNTAVWGPWEDNGVEFIFAIENAGSEGWNWGLGVRTLGDSTDYVDVLVGHVDENAVTEGTFGFDLTAMAQFDPAMTEEGELVVDYAIDQTDVLVSVYASVSELEESAELAVEYGHDQTEAGWMELALSSDLDGSDSDAHELMLLHSRWTADGAGRGDALVTEGDLGVYRYYVSECWSTSGEVVYESNSLLLDEQGDATDCSFGDAVYPEV